jgi:hypothetical protein
LLDEVTSLRTRLAELEKSELASAGASGTTLEFRCSSRTGDKESVA